MAKTKGRTTKKNWCAIDLHMHTPASSDFKQTGVTYLDILQRAEAQGLDIISFTDHNTIAGYRKMQEEIEQLELLKTLKLKGSLLSGLFRVFSTRLSRN